MQGPQLSFVIRHSTLSNIVKEFGRLQRKEFVVSSCGEDSVLFSSEPPSGVGLMIAAAVTTATMRGPGPAA